MAEPIVLASASPRRADLLRSAGLSFVIEPADIDETPRPTERPIELVDRLSSAKALALAGARVVVAADTVVDLDGVVLGKPLDAANAAATLRRLSGRPHLVHTGVTVARGEIRRSTVVTTEVRFVALTDDDIAAYVATGEPLDKAGSYAIQGGAARFVVEVRGSVTNVIGLPLAETIALLRGFGVAC